MPHLYTPVRNGFAQSAYPDQQATALPGMLAFTGDCNLVDAFLVGDVGDAGLEAGLAVVAVPAANPLRPGLNGLAVLPPEPGSSGADIVGVVVRSQQMRSNNAGQACHWSQDVCSVARPGRSGARVWARLADGAQPAPGDTARVIVTGAQAGRFSASDGVSVDHMRFLSTADGDIALVELM